VSAVTLFHRFITKTNLKSFARMSSGDNASQSVFGVVAGIRHDLSVRFDLRGYFAICVRAGKLTKRGPPLSGPYKSGPQSGTFKNL
jgi:hypothetical protein